MHKDGIKSRVTTLIHRPLTRSASPSIWQYFCNITVAPGAAYWSSKSFLITFNAQLVNVFGISFPCASHHPAALCMFRSYLLLSVIAVAVCNCLHMSIIIKVVFGNVNVKFALPTISACRRLYGGFSCPERLFRSVHALSVFHKEPFLKFPSFSQPAVYFHALSVILPE